jgi:hypothetical protein
LKVELRKAMSLAVGAKVMAVIVEAAKACEERTFGAD